ncbi:MAG: hypothetical protein WAV79_00550 [Anaerolineae bacterium]
MRATNVFLTDSRIEPIAIGERQWLDDRSSLLIESARREGVAVAPMTTA